MSYHAGVSGKLIGIAGGAIVGTFPVWEMPGGTRCGPGTSVWPCPPGVPVRNVSSLGQLSMDPATQAALKACSDKCDQQFGVPSGAPNILALGPCFASCNLQFPPTIAIPGGVTVAPPSTQEAPPAVSPDPVGPTPLTNGDTGTDMKLWVIGGVVALAAVGAFMYSKKKGR